MKCPLLINMNSFNKLIFISRTNFILSWVEHENSFITSGLDCRMHRLIWIIAGHTCLKVWFLTWRLLCRYSSVSFSLDWRLESKRDVFRVKVRTYFNGHVDLCYVMASVAFRSTNSSSANHNYSRRHFEIFVFSFSKKIRLDFFVIRLSISRLIFFFF